jgi:hypothetical protein
MRKDEMKKVFFGRHGGSFVLGSVENIFKNILLSISLYSLERVRQNNILISYLKENSYLFTIKELF